MRDELIAFHKAEHAKAVESLQRWRKEFPDAPEEILSYLTEKAADRVIFHENAVKYIYRTNE